MPGKLNNQTICICISSFYYTTRLQRQQTTVMSVLERHLRNVTNSILQLLNSCPDFLPKNTSFPSSVGEQDDYLPQSATLHSLLLHERPQHSHFIVKYLSMCEHMSARFKNAGTYSSFWLAPVIL